MTTFGNKIQVSDPTDACFSFSKWNSNRGDVLSKAQLLSSSVFIRLNPRQKRLDPKVFIYESDDLAGFIPISFAIFTITNHDIGYEDCIS